MRENCINLIRPSHNSPSQQEPNIIPDEHHTTPPIWSPMFKGQLIQVIVTHRNVTHIKKKRVNKSGTQL